ncbi:MAG TPA: M43 family zinc metalloprotease [Chitinophagales bacterium]|jgi:hypothetical protein|nr:zinc-dependent metalloprotease [Chitinophagales bacterium]HQV77562.1 M43 family zinc metalloprotease [Chitinophagales bacterium]HQW79613.1 M43 family zinc metalloprotease [Chitinophagales bacterium]HRB92222.1 M43 family zinc metalloprotease [Chitinophagales bacterium]HRB92225.1 M43 family zinc metalloprotease [Chitinophagales bacterium]
MKLNYKCKFESKLFLVCFFLTFFNIGSYKKSTAQEYKCANENFKFYQNQQINFLEQLQPILDTSSNSSFKINNTVLEIPIAVHVLHLGEPIGLGSNISDQKIYDAIEATNQYWSGTKFPSLSNNIDVGVQFCLAQFDPNGNPSSGIIRKDASMLPNYSSVGIGYIDAFLNGIYGSDEMQTKNLSHWPNSYVMNIWVVHKIAGNWGGYAYFPIFPGDYTIDGIVVLASTINNHSSTLAHELGHTMSLFHTFQGSENGCPDNSNCQFQGDWICDTPPHKINDCATTTCSSDTNILVSMKNIMSYCNNDYIFTPKQKERIRATLFNSYRNKLLQSTACTGIISNIKTNHLLKKMEIYPNPITNQFKIYYAVQQNEIIQMDIINSLGQVVQTEILDLGNEHTISIHQKISKGIYQIILKEKNELKATASIVIQ